MVRRVALVALAVLVVGGLVWAAGVKEVTGTVKSITGGTFVVTDSAGKDWTFAVDSKETLVVAKGGHHKLDALKAGGKPATIDQFMAPKDPVVVKYGEKDGNMTAKEVHVTKK
jgi:hypothetical protein